MTITDLYNKLSDKDFQNYLTGNLFFPAYMYPYDPEQEYEIEQEILSIRDRLHRPTNYLNIMIVDIFEEFIAHLKAERFGPVNMFDRLMKEEEKHPEKVFKSLKQSAHHKNFFKFINDRITKHFQKYEKAKVAYVLLKGFGKIYPYLRASKFISNFEAHLSSPEFGYKLIIFYPGRTSGNNYQMFNLLNDENLYRAHNLKS